MTDPNAYILDVDFFAKVYFAIKDTQDGTAGKEQRATIDHFGEIVDRMAEYARKGNGEHAAILRLPYHKKEG